MISREFPSEPKKSGAIVGLEFKGDFYGIRKSIYPIPGSKV